MKVKMMVFGMLMMAGIVFAGPQNAQAATYFVGHIVQQGQNLDNSIVVLTHVTTGTPAWVGEKAFILNPSSAKQMLAVALTAQSLGKDVVVEIHPTITNQLVRLLVKND